MELYPLIDNPNQSTPVTGRRIPSQRDVPDHPKSAFSQHTQPAFSPLPQQADVPIVQTDEIRAIARPERPFSGLWARLFWVWEAIACLFALGILIGIVATLSLHDNKTLPAWPFSISLNSLLAVLSAIFKAFLLFPVAECLSELKWIWFSAPRPVVHFDHFESASRGPWGSAKLLFRFPWNPLSTLGAIITIVALAVDPFTQQIIQFQSCMITDPSNLATVTRTNNYTSFGTRFGAGLFSLDGDMTVALYQGLLSPPANATSSVAFGCVTGNCTFSDAGGFTYRSLAVCSSVQDIGNTVIQTDSSSFGSYSPTNYSLPSGIWVDGEQQTLSTTSRNLTRVTKFPQSLYDFETLIVKLGYSPNGETGASTYAFRVSINLCVQEYVGVNVMRNKLDETVRVVDQLGTNLDFSGSTILQTFSLVGDLPAYPGVDCTPAGSPQGAKTLPSLPAYDGGPRYVNRSESVQNFSDLQYFDPLCAYEVGFQSWSALFNELDKFFNGQTLESPEGPAYPPVGDAWLLNLYNNGTPSLDSVSKYMTGFDNAMTAAIRSHGDAASSTPVNGTVLSTDTCVRVRWRWLALPAVLLFLTVVLLTATAITSFWYTRNGAISEGRTPWKSSLLPLLWCGLQDTTRRRYGTLDSKAVIQENSKSLKVKLRRHGDWAGMSSKDDQADQGRWVLKEE